MVPPSKKRKATQPFAKNITRLQALRAFEKADCSQSAFIEKWNLDPVTRAAVRLTKSTFSKWWLDREYYFRIEEDATELSQGSETLKTVLLEDALLMRRRPVLKFPQATRNVLVYLDSYLEKNSNVTDDIIKSKIIEFIQENPAEKAEYDHAIAEGEVPVGRGVIDTVRKKLHLRRPKDGMTALDRAEILMPKNLVSPGNDITQLMMTRAERSYGDAQSQLRQSIVAEASARECEHNLSVDDFKAIVKKLCLFFKEKELVNLYSEEDIHSLGPELDEYLAKYGASRREIIGLKRLVYKLSVEDIAILEQQKAQVLVQNEGEKATDSPQTGDKRGENESKSNNNKNENENENDKEKEKENDRKKNDGR